eukprot:TRINITY_DN2118_c0_g1_i3.p1 TRINITY_DN2118_c0_g1~~TRINITY_DN2118_c0_g1_i3.p1  ORF type:complete len:136 (-),score=11.34 TRINITY_DN2118_c0_g1_i3:33-440(-)
MTTDILVLQQAPTYYQPRISTACDFCKRLHIKCDGSQSCSNCSKRNLICMYSTNKRRRPKPKKPKSDPNLDQIDSPPSLFVHGDDTLANLITYFVQEQSSVEILNLRNLFINAQETSSLGCLGIVPWIPSRPSFC